MILLDSNSKNTPSSSFSQMNSKDDKATTFSDLLRGFGDKKDAKIVQNGSLVLALTTNEADNKIQKPNLKVDKNVLLSKNENSLADTKTQEIVELNPRLELLLSPKEIKNLMHEAKNYLKDKILQSDEYKKSQIKELPKTLEGLVKVAEKFGIDITKITLEEVREHTKSTPKIKNSDESLAKDDKQTKTLHVEQSKEVKPTKSLHVEQSKETKQTKTLHVADEQKNIDMQNIKPAQQETQSSIKSNQTPLFKAQQAEVVHQTTEQLVQTKVNNVSSTNQKTSKDKADETLKLLLRGENKSTASDLLTSDFSVATAKVIAPQKGEDTNILEKLLQGESFKSEESPTTNKTDSAQIQKADSIEVKINEAKQMIRYLSTDIKSAIDDYKSPFTRVKIQLNPQNLGEVDLTIVQRGKDLHVNISSNNTAINTLAANTNELKTQLNNSGINNATLNFSNNSQNSDTNSGGHHNKQNEKRAHEEYNYFDNEEANEEILSSLEIIVPRYI